MSINRIKANSVEFEGDYVHIIRTPKRSIWFCAGIAIGLLVILFIINPAIHGQYVATEHLVILYFIIITVCGGLAAIVSGEKEEYLVPRADVLAIKKYPERQRVTVVLDDERMKYPFVK